MTQQVLFSDINTNQVPLDNVAHWFGISQATAKNWVKTGYLKQEGKGFVSLDSFERLKQDIYRDNKLISRANKSLKDSHNHSNLQDSYFTLLENSNTNGNDIAIDYEKSLSNSYKNKEGVYYTPVNITQEFFQYLPKDCTSLSFCDPCCGSGNFIISAIEYGFNPKNIYGYDIDPVAVKITKKRIFEKTGYITNNILCLDFLESNLQPTNQKFDVIFTNPPWGKKITREQKNTYSKVLKAGKSNDTSSLFFFASLNNLENNGYLGFLLQDAFFNIASYESARDKALSKQILAVIDFNKPFTGLITKAKGILIKNQDSNDNSIVKCENKNKNFNRLQYSFLSNPKLILNTNISQGEADVVAYLYSLNHITLFNKARWGLGIVTGNNKKFIQHIQTQGLVPVYKGVDIDKNHIANASNYISDDLSIYQQTATKELYLAPEKLIYRFISSDLVFYYDTKQRYILNSANFLIPNSNFLISQSQLKDILNSRVVNWMFKSIFNTHKVLRSDLEILPIHFGYFDKYEYFDDDVFISYLGLKECSDGTFRIKK